MIQRSTVRGPSARGRAERGDGCPVSRCSVSSWRSSRATASSTRLAIRVPSARSSSACAVPALASLRPPRRGARGSRAIDASESYPRSSRPVSTSKDVRGFPRERTSARGAPTRCARRGLGRYATSLASVEHTRSPVARWLPHSNTLLQATSLRDELHGGAHHSHDPRAPNRCLIATALDDARGRSTHLASPTESIEMRGTRLHAARRDYAPGSPGA